MKELNKGEKDSLRIKPISEKEWLNYFKNLWASNHDEPEILIDIDNSVDCIALEELREAIKACKNKNTT